MVISRNRLVELDQLLKPSSVVIVGASGNENKVSGQPLKYLIEHGFKGNIYLVNPNYNNIKGYPCFTSVTDLPREVDVAIITVSSKLIPSVLEECDKKGIKFAVIFTAGFEETGSTEFDISKWAKKHSLRIVGPNCQGLLNVWDSTVLGFGDVFMVNPIKKGNVSLVAQSGIGLAYMAQAQHEGVGFRYAITIGNESDLTLSDFIEHFINDENTEVIVAYLESLKDGERFLSIAKRALEANKPILIIKGGLTEVGQKAVSSHTGHIASPAKIYEGIFKQFGLIRISDVIDLVDFVKMFSGGKLPAGNNVGIVTASGGAGILMADECGKNGLQIPELSPAQKIEFNKFLPDFASANNPVDVTAQIFNDEKLFRKSTNMLLESDNIDSLAIVGSSLQGQIAKKIAEDTVYSTKCSNKPVLVSMMTLPHLAKEAINIFYDNKVPYFPSPVRAGKALAKLTEYAQAKNKDSKKELNKFDISQAELNIFLKNKMLTEYNVKKFLFVKNFPTVKEVLATSEQDVIKASREIGYPVVLKGQSPEILHKTDANIVRISLQDEEEVKEAYHVIMCNMKKYKRDVVIEGVLVQEMVINAREMIIGLNNNEFGKTIMIGLGGIFTEVMKDVCFRVPPVNEQEVFRMLNELKGLSLLKEFRGQDEADIEALATFVSRFSSLVTSLPREVTEFEINPLFIMPKGKGVKIGDALLVIDK